MISSKMQGKNNYPVRIAHIIGKMCAGGVESVAFNYYRAIDHTKFQFDFYYDADSTAKPPPDLMEMGARFIKIPPYQKLPQYIQTLRKHLRNEKYLIVHSHLNTLSVFPLFAAWCEHVPFRIAHNHSVPGGDEYGRNALKFFLKNFSTIFANAFCACSEQAGQWLFGNVLFKKGEITILKNAIDYKRFIVEDELVYNKKNELGMPEKALVIGHVGRFTAAKNHQKIISIFEAVKKKKREAILLLVGDGEERDSIIKRIKQDGIEHIVYLTGKVEKPEYYYPLMDVLILPSVFEGVPVTIIEAQIAGVSCVISDVVNKDVIISNACHCMSIDDTDEAWAEKVLEVCNENVVLSELSKTYNIHEAVKTLEIKYEKLLRG